MSSVFGILLAVVLLAANAFFVGAEFAIISARRDRLEALAAQGKRGARAVIKAGENLQLMLAGAQLGVTICSILLGRVAEPAIAHLIETPMEWMGAAPELLHPVGFAIALSLVAVLHILLGEMVPKNIALAGPERSALLLVPVHLAWLRLARPLIWFYNFIAAMVLKVLRIPMKNEVENTVSALELSEILGESREEGLLDEGEHRRLKQALANAERTIADVIIPLESARFLRQVNGGTRLGDIEQAVVETGYSRYPVRATSGTLVGYIHLKDVLDEVGDESVGPETIIPYSDIRPLVRLPVRLPLYEAVTRMRRASSHMGEVLDARGVTVGIVTLEDLIEEFVGQVRDSTHRVRDVVPGRPRQQGT
ncbi:hemolysin family protein [Smaragdicoccus niigatensis]|uniref:hemolysin family protein n=1 Tax=Smaragdicoccus niigatensis TaxID=359359 RepID=UPI00036640BD|nr:hemolysin family protein [Smaragdicoccus niigatensis]